MEKNIKNSFCKPKNLELKGTLGESLRDAIIKARIKATEDSSYATGNIIEKFVEIATILVKGINFVNKLSFVG